VGDGAWVNRAWYAKERTARRVVGSSVIVSGGEDFLVGKPQMASLDNNESAPPAGCTSAGVPPVEGAR
jgi:hypothetical protein